MKKTVLALGYFDSIHIGHKELLCSAIRYAVENDAVTSVATFDDGFLKAVNRNEKEIFLLNEKIDLLKKIGINNVLVFPSDKDFLSKSKEDFCSYIDGLRPAGIFVGSDYKFGRRAEGDVSYLKNRMDIPVFVKEIISIDGKKVSTTDIRHLLSEGKIEKANSLLSYPYFIQGEVKEGRKEGRKMHLPTVNLFPDENKLLPKAGVYITECLIEGKSYKSVTNVGIHPSFGDNTFNVETHIIDFNDDLYGKNIKIIFHRFIRDIKFYNDIKDLKSQINNDILTTKEYYK